MKNLTIILLFCFLSSPQIWAQKETNLLLIIDPFSDSRTGPEKLEGPRYLDNRNLHEVLNSHQFPLVKKVEIEIPEEKSQHYGEWNRASISNNVLMHSISDYEQNEVFVLALLGGNKSVTGMLAGLQHMGPDRKPLKDSRGKDIIGLPRIGDNKPLKVGLVWIHSEAAFNTPDITLKGDMGGMNLAVAAGRSNAALRLQAGLDPPISEKDILILGGWDISPYEEHALDNSFITVLPLEKIKSKTASITNQMELISNQVDLIYVHLDLSVLDKISFEETETILDLLMGYQKVAALGVASCPENPSEEILNLSNLLIESALNTKFDFNRK